MKPERKFLNSIFEVTHLEFQTYDLSNQKLLFSNGVVRKLLGYTEEEYHAVSDDFYKKIVHPDDFEKIKEMISQIAKSKSGEILEMTVRLRKSDGNYIWVYSRQMMYEKDSDKHICTMIREVEDVTKLIELQTELEEKVAQLNLISYKNSHMLRSPVASIIGLVNLIEEHGVSGDHNRQVFQFLKDTITKLDAVIHEISGIANLD